MGAGQSTDINEDTSKQTIIHKGLENLVGHNNCFLNVVIQVLWHIDAFRLTLQDMFESSGLELAGVRKLVNNDESTNITLLNAVCSLFLDYQNSFRDVIQPCGVREALWILSGKFQFGEIADSNEALDEILKQLHKEDAKCGTDNDHQCLAHRIFGGGLVDIQTCQLCSDMSEPSIPTNFLHYIYAMELLEVSQEYSNNHNHQQQQQQPSLGELVHQCALLSLTTCPRNNTTTSTSTSKSTTYDKPCAGRSTTKTWCLTPPLCVSIAVNWTSPNESPETLQKFMNCITPSFILSDLFAVSAEEYKDCTYYFRVDDKLSMKQSLSSSSSSSFSDHFVLLDDSRKRSLGGWRAVMEECVKARYQPVLLLYEIATIVQQSHKKTKKKKILQLLHQHQPQQQPFIPVIARPQLDLIKQLKTSHSSSTSQSHPAAAAAAAASKHEDEFEYEFEDKEGYNMGDKSFLDRLDDAQKESTAAATISTNTNRSININHSQNKSVQRTSIASKDTQEEDKDKDVDGRRRGSEGKNSRSHSPLLTFEDNKNDEESKGEGDELMDIDIDDMVQGGVEVGGGTVHDHYHDNDNDNYVPIAPCKEEKEYSNNEEKSHQDKGKGCDNNDNAEDDEFDFEGMMMDNDELYDKINNNNINHDDKDKDKDGPATVVSARNMDSKEDFHNKRVDIWDRSPKINKVKLDLRLNGCHGLICEQSGTDIVIT
eukprot:gene5859-11831_t